MLNKKPVVIWVNDDMSCDQGLVNYIERKYKCIVRRANSTEIALRMLRSNSTCCLVVTNLRRGNDSEAGITLYKEMKNMNSNVRCIVYTGRIDQRLKDKFLSLGGYAYTCYEDDLLDYVDCAFSAAEAD